MKILASLSLLLISAMASSSFAQGIPKGYTISEMTLSPDHKYGILVPLRNDDLDDDALSKLKNQIIEVKTGHIIGAIQAEAAFEIMNHDDLLPTVWNKDNTAFLWLVDGKWGFNTEILVKFTPEKITLQVDVLDLLQKEMLKRTLAAAPQKYAAVKKQGEGDGSWFKDGFAIDCVPEDEKGPLKFPLQFSCYLSSDVKGVDDEGTVNARMTAQVNADGTIKVQKFSMGNTPQARTW